MAANGVAAYIVPLDEEGRRTWISGFSGSNGDAIIAADQVSSSASGQVLRHSPTTRWRRSWPFLQPSSTTLKVYHSVSVMYVILVKKHCTHDFRFCSSRGTVDDPRAEVGAGARGPRPHLAPKSEIICIVLLYENDGCSLTWHFLFQACFICTKLWYLHWFATVPDLFFFVASILEAAAETARRFSTCGFPFLGCPKHLFSVGSAVL